LWVVVVAATIAVVISNVINFTLGWAEMAVLAILDAAAVLTAVRVL
jgi:hypothetical protein